MERREEQGERQGSKENKGVEGSEGEVLDVGRRLKEYNHRSRERRETREEMRGEGGTIAEW